MTVRFVRRRSHSIFVFCFRAITLIAGPFFAVASVHARNRADTVVAPPDPPTERAIDNRVNVLLRRMTLEEKIGQLSQGVAATPEAVDQVLAAVRDGKIGELILSVPPEFAREAHKKLQHAAVAESRLGIPLLLGFDAIHGYRTIFPIPLGIAATWDESLAERAQTISARECRAGGLNWVFAPMSDVARDPRWGRVAETFGEDPVLTSHFVAATVRGFQGSDPAAPGRVAATLKHFAGYGASEGGRDYNATEIPPFTFFNVHLPPFRAGVAAGAVAVMSSFNANDGIPTVGNRALLTDVLRGEWGFPGFVVSDWNSVKESIAWGYASGAAEAARFALVAGNDMEMVSTTFRDTLPQQVRDGEVPTSVLDEAVRRVLRIKVRLGLFDRDEEDLPPAENAFLQPDALALARTIAARSVVLLENPGVLPLSKSLHRIALIGPLGDDPSEMLGTWPGFGRSEDVVDLAAGIRAKVGDATVVDVVHGCDLLDSGPRTRAMIDGTIVADDAHAREDDKTHAALDDRVHARFDAAVNAARNADAVVLAIGEPRGWSGENASRADLSLTGAQEDLLRAVAAVGKPTVLIVFSGRPLVLPEFGRASVARVQAWHPGVQAGNGIADILFGDVAPTGRLPISFPRSVGQLPIFYNRLATGRPQSVDYRDSTSKPRFPFGFGLTYTTFSYGAVEIVPPSRAGAPAIARATVTNTGTREGEEVAQLYIRDVACSDGARPVQELRGWKRLKLAPGESKTVDFPLTNDVLGYFDRSGRWRVEAGAFHVWIAPHAETDGAFASYTLPPDRETPGGRRTLASLR